MILLNKTVPTRSATVRKGNKVPKQAIKPKIPLASYKVYTKEEMAETMRIIEREGIGQLYGGVTRVRDTLRNRNGKKK